MRDYTCLDGMIGNAESMLKAAYDKGYNQGVVDHAYDERDKITDIRDIAYNNGAKNMYYAVLKVLSLNCCGGYTNEEREEIFGTMIMQDILDMFRDNPLLLIEKVKEYEERKKKQESDIHCHYLNRTCPYDIPCLTCDVCKAFEAAMEKVKENEND